MDSAERVLRRVGKAEGTEPSELETPLYEVVDPEALNALFEQHGDGRQDEGAVQFPYHGYEVTVHADGTVSLREQG